MSGITKAHCLHWHINQQLFRTSISYKNLGRKSFSFTNPQVREIERQNQILLKKMMNVKPTIKPSTNAIKSSSKTQGQVYRATIELISIS